MNQKQSRQLNECGSNVPTSFPDADVFASLKSPRMISKNPQAEEPSMKGEDKLPGLCQATRMTGYSFPRLLDDCKLAFAEMS